MAFTTLCKSFVAVAALMKASSRDEGAESRLAQGGLVDAPSDAGDVVPPWLVSLETVLMSSETSLGRERASATTLALPCK